jgi:hypothetical protein
MVHRSLIGDCPLRSGISSEMLLLLYSATVLVCWFVTRKFLLGVLLAVPVDVALYCLASVF